eukprot:UN04620
MPCTLDQGDVLGSKRVHPHQTMIPHFVGATTQNQVETADDALFNSWSIAHQKMYLTAAERAGAKANFLNTKAMIIAHNKNPQSKYVMGLNQFADMSPAQLRAHTGRKASAAADRVEAMAAIDKCTQYKPVGGDIPKAWRWDQQPELKDFLDYTKETRLKSQMACGSCFVQAASHAVSSDYYLRNKGGFVDNNKIASVQAMLDCTREYGNESCNGGEDWRAISWFIEKADGFVPDDASYGLFKNADSFCNFGPDFPAETKQMKKFAKIESCEHVGNQWNTDEPQDQEQLIKDLKDALYNHGPVSISIAVPTSLYYYQGGVYDDDEACGSALSDLSHSVLAIGYTEDEIIFANSWSSAWGAVLDNQPGLGRIAIKGKNGKFNVCGVATTPLVISTSNVD